MQLSAVLLFMVLAIEFSSAQRSVALVGHSDQTGATLLAQVVETGGRAARACAMIEQALRECGADRQNINRIAIGIGPGSYNGIRAAIAFAQGWQLSRGLPLTAVSSVHCLAAQAQSEGLTGKVAIVIDAQRQEFYLAVFDLTADRRQEIEPLRLASRAQVESTAQAGNLLLGPDASRWFPQARALYPSAEMAGKLAIEKGENTPGHLIEPVYLRQPEFVKASVRSNH
jgi:tRNA threonylcarbamoyladenosine biosynthesis protein TsaB